MIDLLTNLNWAAVGQIIMIDILLGGDNAVVIALACRNLPAKQRTRGIILGTMGAIVLRVILIAFAVSLLMLPWLKIVGGLLLVWIGVKLLAPDDGDGHADVSGGTSLMSAVRTVIVADLVMSIDNVIGIAAAAQQADSDHQLGLVVFGLLVSIPIIVWGSRFVIHLIERYPLVIWLGGALLGWIAGGMIVSDTALTPWLGAEIRAGWRLAAEVIGAIVVVGVARLIVARRPAEPLHRS